jgi:hypothetical protein
MRSLRRPMFRYGGDVKAQGVMHGMKNMQDGGPATMADATGYANGGMSNNQGPRRAALVGNPVYPVGPDGRTGHSAYRVIGGGLLNLAKKYGPDKNTIKNFYQGLKTKTTGKDGMLTAAPDSPGFLNFIKRQLPSNRFRDSGSIIPMGGRANPKNLMVPYGSTVDATGKVGYLKSLTDAKRLGQAMRENKFLTVAGAGQIKNLPDYLGTAKDLGVGAVQGTTNYLLGTEFGKEKPPVLKKTPTGDRGSLLKTDSAPKVLSKEEVQAKDDARLAKIYKLLGVDRSQRNAASKALVDVSRYIDEGGKDTVSKKNIGSTISKAISSFDKRLDKSDQLKEAAGVMMAKSYLEGGDKAQDREYKQVMIDAKKKEMNPDLSDLKAMYTKSGVTDAAGAAASKKFGSAYGGALMSTKDFNKQLKAFEGEQLEEQTILDIASNAVNNLELASEGGAVSDGYYKVGTNIVLIKEGKAVELVG